VSVFFSRSVAPRARRRFTGRTALALAASLLLSATAVTAQELELKRTLPRGQPGGCPPGGAPGPAADNERARSLFIASQDAAVAGERSAALALLAQASRLDSTDPDIAYFRARLLEEEGDTSAAAAEYCRFLSLAGNSPDAPEVRDRLRNLAAAFPADLPTEVVAQFRHGVTYFDQRNLRAANRAFSYVVQQQPQLAAAYYNRAVVHLAQRRQAAASRDLEAYLALAPDAPDRALVLQHLQQPTGERTLTPVGVFARGLLIPGLGQFSSQRPLAGALVTLGTAGAVAFALQSRNVERTSSFVDPFDNPREYAYEAVERPYLSAGVAAAVAITLFGATEAYLHAQNSAGRGAAQAQPQTESRGVTALIEPGRNGLRVGLQLPLGNH
jgi:tetratricopeptide (TPR) repeat protein